MEGCAVFFSATFSVVIYGLVFGSWSFLGLCMIPVWGVGLKNALEGFGAFLWVDVVGTVNWLSASRLCECSI